MNDKPSNQIRRVLARLLEVYGIPTWREPLPPLDELVSTILSQNTNDRNRDNGFHRLRERFDHWEDVMNGRVEDVEFAIRPAGLSQQKSARIVEALRWVNDREGSLSLEFLRTLSDDEIIETLTALKGVGVKTAAVLAAFSLGRDLCPVDTHVHRIALRTGWAEPKMSAEKVFYHLRPAIPAGNAPTFHLNLLKLGRTICTARSPKCGICPLADDCSYNR